MIKLRQTTLRAEDGEYVHYSLNPLEVGRRYLFIIYSRPMPQYSRPRSFELCLNSRLPDKDLT